MGPGEEEDVPPDYPSLGITLMGDHEAEVIEHEDAPSMPLHHGAFEVDDIEAAQKSVRGQGVETTDITQRHDGQRVFYLHDTEGNRIEICTKSGFGVLV